MTSKEMIDIIVLNGSRPLKEKYPRESLTKANGWEECPVPTMLGIPLMAKPICPYPGGRAPAKQPAVYLLVEPIEGYAPCRWQLGPRCNPGMLGFGRRDGKPFTIQQWTDLHSFIDHLMDLYGAQMDSQIIISEKINLEYFKNYLRSKRSPLAGQQQPVYMCSRCDSMEGPKKCGRCQCTYYCTRECQVYKHFKIIYFKL